MNRLAMSNSFFLIFNDKAFLKRSSPFKEFPSTYKSKCVMQYCNVQI